MSASTDWLPGPWKIAAWPDHRRSFQDEPDRATPPPGRGNVFSGNATGIAIPGHDRGNLIEELHRDEDRTGTALVGNTGVGVSIDHTPNVMVGGNVAGGRNIISGNLAAGVSVTGPTGGGGFASGSNAGVKIVGNFISTNTSGANPLEGNLGPGVYIDAPSNGRTGGTAGAFRATRSPLTTPALWSAWTRRA